MDAWQTVYNFKGDVVCVSCKRIVFGWLVANDCNSRCEILIGTVQLCCRYQLNQWVVKNIQNCNRIQTIWFYCFRRRSLLPWPLLFSSSPAESYAHQNLEARPAPHDKGQRR